MTTTQTTPSAAGQSREPLSAYERGDRVLVDLPCGVTVEVDLLGLVEPQPPEVRACFESLEAVYLPGGATLRPGA